MPKRPRIKSISPFGQVELQADTNSAMTAGRRRNGRQEGLFLVVSGIRASDSPLCQALGSDAFARRYAASSMRETGDVLPDADGGVSERKRHPMGSAGLHGGASCARQACQSRCAAHFLPPYGLFGPDPRFFRPQDLACSGASASLFPDTLEPHFFHGVPVPAC